MPSTVDHGKKKRVQTPPKEENNEATPKQDASDERVCTVKPARWNSADTNCELLSHVQYFFKMNCPFYYDPQYQVYKLYEPIIVKLLSDDPCANHEGKLCSHSARHAV